MHPRGSEDLIMETMTTGYSDLFLETLTPYLIAACSLSINSSHQETSEGKESGAAQVIPSSLEIQVFCC